MLNEKNEVVPSDGTRWHFVSDALTDAQNLEAETVKPCNLVKGALILIIGQQMASRRLVCIRLPRDGGR
jgi:hypothetical protein